MALTIIATAKATNANSFITLADAELYMEGRLAVTTWDAATDDDKNRSIKMATDRLELEPWQGARTTQAQRLQWPRYGATDLGGWNYDQDEIPRPIEEATCELALALTDGTYAVAPDALAAYDRVRVGDIDVSPRSDYTPANLPDAVRDLIQHLLAAGVGDHTVHIVRG